MKEFRYLSYSTSYKSRGDLLYDKQNAACFMDIFRNVKPNHHNVYSIYLSKKIKSGKSNFCPFNKSEILNHIRILHTIHNFKYKVKETKTEYIVELDITHKPTLFHKYALTWIRYLYEFPYNMILRDIYNWSKLFPFESIANMMNVGIYCSQDIIDRCIHQIPTFGAVEFLRTKDVRHKLIKCIYINDIYNGVKCESYRYNFGDDLEQNLEYWKERAEERLNTFRNAYYLIKKSR